MIISNPNKETVFSWIANDHLAEFKDYYTRLEQMEKEAKTAQTIGHRAPVDNSKTGPTKNQSSKPKPEEY